MPVDLHLPSVSVVVTTYNRPKSLVRLLKHLAVQVHVHWMEHEIFVVDDGSETELWPVIRDTFVGVEDKFRYLRRERDEGSPHLYANLNWGAKEATKEVLWFLQDDLYVDDHTLLIIQLLHKAYQDSCLIPHYANVSDPGWYQYPGSILPVKSYRQCGSMAWSGLSIPRWWWLEVEGADESFDGSMGWADVDFGIRLLQAGCNIALVRGICCFSDDAESGGSWRNRVLTPWRREHPNQHDPNGVKLWQKWPFMKPDDA